MARSFATAEKGEEVGRGLVSQSCHLQQTCHHEDEIASRALSSPWFALGQSEDAVAYQFGCS